MSVYLFVWLSTQNSRLMIILFVGYYELQNIQWRINLIFFTNSRICVTSFNFKNDSFDYLNCFVVDLYSGLYRYSWDTYDGSQTTAVRFLERKMVLSRSHKYSSV